MINVSDAYLVAITADSEETAFHAEFGFVPPGAREGLTLTQSGFGRWGNRLAQLNNRVYGMGAKWASLELNRSAFGGGYRYIDLTKNQQTGEWSELQSRADGTFASPPFIEMTLDADYDLIGTQVIFDDLGEEWATEIKVTYYNAAGTVIAENIFANTVAKRSIDFQHNGVRRVRHTFNAWNLPGRFAKVCQVVPGQIRYFTDDNIYSFSLREKISPFEPLTIPEYTLVFPNEDQEYNIINPTGLVSKLRELMEMPSSIGLVTAAGIEHVSTGNFYLFSWPDSADDETAAFNCRPDLALANREYENTAGNITVAAAAARISAQAALHTPVAVDPALASINVRGSISDRQSTQLQSALGQLAIAAGGIIKFERDGTYTLKPLTIGGPVRQLSYFNGMWGKPQIKQEPPIYGVTVRYSTVSSNRMVSAEELVLSGNSFGENKEVISNFIASAAEARRIGALALAFYNNRLTYKIDYRGDMSIEAGDVISVETDYGFRNVLVLEHEILYDNEEYLQGKITGVEV